MRAAIFRGIGMPLSIETLPEPKPGARDVLLRVGRCGICGTDLHMTETAAGGFSPGATLGHEYAGEIVELGSEVSHLDIGDRVAVQPMRGCGSCAECRRGDFYGCTACEYTMGGFGEYTVASANSVVKLPSSLSWSDGALVEPLATALNGVSTARIPRGGSALVIGAGAMGLGATFWARRLGAGRIIVASRSGNHAQLAAALGADAFMKTGGGFLETVKEAFAGLPDVVFECTGAPGMIELSVNCVARRGTVLVLGMCSIADPWIPATAVYKQVRLQFAAAYSMGDFYHCVDTLAAGALQPRAMISGTVSLDALPEAFEALRRRAGNAKSR